MKISFFIIYFILLGFISSLFGTEVNYPKVKVKLKKSSGITFINYFDDPIYSTIIELDAEALYSQTGITVGIPIKIYTSDGRILPVRYNAVKKSILVYLSLNSRERLEGEIVPASKWYAEDQLVKAKWDAINSEGKVENGLLSVTYNSEGIGINYFDPITGSVSKKAISGIRFKGWIDSRDNGMLDAFKAVELGLTKIDMLAGDIIEATALKEGDRAILTVRKKYDSELCKNLMFEEIITLFDFEPIVEYRIRIVNQATDPVYLANLTGGESTFYGEYADLFKTNNLLLFRDSKSPRGIPPIMILSANGTSSDALKPSQGWKRRMTYIEAENGYGFGASMIIDQELSPQWHRWHNGMTSFGMVTTTAQSSLPVKITPELPAEMGGVFLLASPGSNGFDGIRKVHDSYMEGKPFSFIGHIGVWMEKKVLDTPVLMNFSEDFSSVCRWRSYGGKILKSDTGIRFEKRDSDSFIAAAFLVKGDWSFKTAVNIKDLSHNSTLSITLESLNNPAFSKEIMRIDKAGYFSTKLDSETKKYLTEGCIVKIILTGKKNSFLEINEFKIVPDIPIPKLLYPENNAEITDISSSFVWGPQEGIASYNIQIASDQDFTNILFQGMTQLPKSNRMDGFSHYAQEMLEPGTYYWRLQAVGVHGTESEWSEERLLKVNNSHNIVAPARKISPGNPLILFDTWRVSDLSGFKNVFPEDIKPYVAFAPTALPHNIIPLKNLEVSNEIGVPYFMQIWTPLCLLEKMFIENDNVLGVFWGEQLGDINRFKRVAALCAKYGKYCMFFDGSMARYQWHELFSDPEFANFLREHKENIVFGHKTNITDLAPLVMGTISGGWLDGLTSNLGMMFEAFYWDHAGYRIDLDHFYGKRGGKANLMPPNFWNQQFLMAITQGATILNIGGQGNTTIGTYDPVKHPDFWIDSDGASTDPTKRYTALFDREGNTTPVWERFILPFLDGIIKHHMIVSRDEVLQTTKLVVLQNKKPIKDQRHFSNYGKYRPLIQNTYGINPEGGEFNDLIPNNGRYFWIPIMPYGSVGLSGKNNIPLSELQDSTKVKNLVDQIYPSWYEGNAWAYKVNDKFYVSSTQENGGAIQSFKFPFTSQFFRHIEGVIGPHKYIMGRVENDGKSLWIQCNTEYPEQNTELIVECDSKPYLLANPSEALIDHQWNEKEGQFKINLSHIKGMVEIQLDSEDFIPSK